MKIAIIGAGWIGCHLAKKLRGFADITIFDKIGIFSGSSFYNQNRLHLGFHYPRNYQTRELCKTTFDRFVDEYPTLVKSIDRNIYAVPIDASTLDFRTYSSIFDHDKISYEIVNCESLSNIEGSILTKETMIDHRLAKEYFLNLHKGSLVIQQIDETISLLSEYDFVINCTNNFIKDNTFQAYYELSLSLVYRRTRPAEFDALTVVDGDFFSIFPYYDDLYTLTSVKHTPVYVSDSPIEIIERAANFSQDCVLKVRDSFINSVRPYYPAFQSNFEYVDYFTSVKTKTFNLSANRYPAISGSGRVINCFTGKIQGIFAIEDTIKEYIVKHERFNR